MDAPALQKCMGETRSHSKVLDLLRELVFAQREMQDVGSTGGFSLSPFAHSKHLMERGETRDIEIGLIKLK